MQVISHTVVSNQEVAVTILRQHIRLGFQITLSSAGWRSGQVTQAI